MFAVIQLNECEGKDLHKLHEIHMWLYYDSERKIAIQLLQGNSQQ